MDKIAYREYKALPKEYWDKQNFCWYIHDIILSIFHNCMENEKMTTKIEFKSEFHRKEFEKAEDIINWLYENDYKYEANDIFGKRIFHAILADMLNFIYESLNNIEKGKITVSLALLRKPFRDNLLYLEWLLGNSEEFINMVNNQDIEKYAIEKLTKDKKIEIIKLAIERIENKEYFSTMNEFIYYDLRYNYKAENSLQRVWNNANHLVTTGKNIRSKEFNFVFLDEELHLDYIEYYYSQVPNLLFYTYNIVIELYNKFIRRILDVTRLYNNSLIIYKLSDLAGTVRAEEYFNKERKVLLNFPCRKCKEMIEIQVNSEEFMNFRNRWGFKCPKCGNDISTSRYIFWEDYKENGSHLKIVK